MLLQKQPNSFSCLPTAFAMVLHRKVEDIISSLGHDGSRILWENCEHPCWKYRGFHPQELIDYCFKEGKAILHIESQPMFKDRTNPNNIPVCAIMDHESRFYNYTNKLNGVLVGEYRTTRYRHALAWFDGESYDPMTGNKGGLDDYFISDFYGIIIRNGS
jgi:hypothetical protein